MGLAEETILIEDNRTAHEEMARLDALAVEAEIKNRDAKMAFEEVQDEMNYRYKEFIKSDPIGAKMEVRKGTASKFAEWVQAETEWWKAKLAYRQAGYKVDCIKNEIELQKSALGTH
jgi:DNA primase large subunit